LSHLIAISFDDPDRARSVRDQLVDLQKQHLVDLEDAAVVVHQLDGRVRLEQSTDLTARGAIGGAFWGTLVGMLFMQPLVGMGVGLASGAIAGRLTDAGIDDDFMRGLGEGLPEGSSALFFLVRRATLDKVMAELAPLDGTVLHTSLSQQEEARLSAILADQSAGAVALPPPAPHPNASSSLGPAVSA
jgi:uncharacterized membrane protein